MSSRRFRFGLRTLLIALAITAVALAVFMQAAMSTGTGEVVASALKLDSDGLVNGTLVWKYNSGPSPGVRFDCYIRRLKNTQLLELNKGDQFSFRYRSMDFPGWPKDDPHRKFMLRAFGIGEKQVIVYVVMAHGVTTIVVDGTK